MKVFRDYAEIEMKKLYGYTVTKITVGVNTEESGVLMELEHQIDNVVIGIDIIYNPDHGEDETSFIISEEYVKSVHR